MHAARARASRPCSTSCARELPLLRAPAGPGRVPAAGPIARRMYAAVAPFASTTFITPMAAVAGAVADDMLAAMRAAAPCAAPMSTMAATSRSTSRPARASRSA